jgi:TPR repeat protein
MAADAGSVQAMVQIAVLYENGQGVAVDLDQARSWYLKAADLGDLHSKRWLTAHNGK